MNSRLFASIAVGALVILGTTGCSMISPQATTIEYNASDGVAVNAGALEVRNALIVANEDGSAGNFLAAIVNTGDSTERLSLEFGEGSDAVSETVTVPAGAVVSLGVDDEEPILIEGLDTMPGADLPVYFASGGEEGTLMDVPVLDGELPYLEPFVP